MGHKAKQPGPDEFELLVSHREHRRHRSGLSGRAKGYFGLLALGLLGCIGCLWAMMYTTHSEQLAHKLGMTRVANSLENILELLALPALLFCSVLVAYALQRLYQLYKSANRAVVRRQG